MKRERGADLLTLSLVLKNRSRQDWDSVRESLINEKLWRVAPEPSGKTLSVP